MSEQNHKEFEKWVRRKERDVFQDYFKDKNATSFNPPEQKETNYLYYPPSWFAEHKLFDREMLKKMQEGGTLISIGSGPAYLERFICSQGAPVKNITICDKSNLHMPANFNRYTFDASSPDWPDFGDKKFDYIIFPESFSLINGAYSDIDRIREDSFTLCHPDEYNQEVIYGTEPFNSVRADLSGAIHLMQKSMEILKPGGEIKCTFVYLNDHYSDPYKFLAQMLRDQYNATLTPDIIAGFRVKSDPNM